MSAGTHQHDLDDPQGHEHDDGDRPAWRRRLVDLVRPHHHEAAGPVDAALEGSSRGLRALAVSFAVLLVTAAAQLALVVATGSVALLSDTIHNVSDALSAVPLAVAFTLGRRAATRRLPHGYGRAEDLAGLAVVALIAVSAAVAAWEAVQRLVDPAPVRSPWLVAVAALVGFAGNELVARYRMRVGREIGSAALVADGLHARSDGFTSLAVLFGAAGVALGVPVVDPIVGLLIAVAILFVLRDASRAVFGRLMDAVDPEVTDRAAAVARDVPEVQGVHDVRLRWIGHRLTAVLAVAVDARLSVAQGHAIAEQVRHDLLHQVAHLRAITVHIDPASPSHDPHAALAHHPDPLGTRR